MGDEQFVAGAWMAGIFSLILTIIGLNSGSTPSEPMYISAALILLIIAIIAAAFGAMLSVATLSESNIQLIPLILSAVVAITSLVVIFNITEK